MLEITETAPAVALSTNQRYFVEDKFLVVDCFYNQTMRPLIKDWIGLYPCENMKLDEPLIFEYVMDHPRLRDKSYFKIRFISQLFAKFIHCSRKYQLVYVDSYFKIVATSDPIQFVHKNDCHCNTSLSPINSTHMKIGQDVVVVIQRLKCLEAKLLEYEEGKKEAIQLHELLVKKLKACEMLRSRGEQFIDGLYNALDQGKPVKLINSKGFARWIKRMPTTATKNYIMSTKTVRNDLFLTAIINTQEQEIQRLKAINDELKTKFLKNNELPVCTSESNDTSTDNTKSAKELKAFTIKSITPSVVKFIDD